MKVALDATPLLGPRTGVGRYVAGLAEALAGLAGPEPESVALVPFSWRGTGDLAAAAPSGPRVRLGRRRAPARLLQAAWGRLPLPPVEWLSGQVDVFHATNFVAPPTRRAATVVTIHDLTYLRFPEMITDASARYRRLVPRALRRGAVVCTPTAAVASEVAAEYHLPPDPHLAGHPRPPGPVSPVRRKSGASQEPDDPAVRLPRAVEGSGGLPRDPAGWG